jgi:dTDP-4-dehydrorhamnose 3,5-epimerase
VRVEQGRVFADERGAFSEIYRASAMPMEFVQSNHSFSRAGALRGLHWHEHQADLWYLVRGRLQVGLVDLRTQSDPPLADSFVLEAGERTAVFIPPGVAHGYLALTDIDLIYWVTSEYDPSDEHGIAWDDPALGIEWQLDGAPVLSDRDRGNPRLRWDALPAFS